MSWKGIQALVGASLLNLVCSIKIFGSFLIWGNICTYVASYLRLTDLTVTLNDMMLIPPLTQLSVCAVSVLGSTLMHRYGAKKIAACGTVVCVVGIGSSAFTTGLLGFALTYGVVAGLGAGLVYTVPLAVCWGHYPAHRARVTGLLLAVFSYSTTLFNLVSTAIVNPDNKPAAFAEMSGTVTSHYFGEEIAKRTPTMLLALAGVFSLLGVFGVLLLNENEDSSPTKDYSSAETLASAVNVPFLTLLVASFLSVSFAMHMLSAYKIYGREIFHDDRYLAFAGSVAAFVNGTSRFLWAEAFERVGFKPVYVALLLVQVVMSLSIYQVARTETLYLYYLIFVFISHGCHSVIFPAAVVDMYGRRKGMPLYSVMHAGFGLAALGASLIQKLVVPNTGYEQAFWIMAGATVASVGLIINLPGVPQVRDQITQPLIAPSAKITKLS